MPEITEKMNAQVLAALKVSQIADQTTTQDAGTSRIIRELELGLENGFTLDNYAKYIELMEVQKTLAMNSDNVNFSAEDQENLDIVKNFVYKRLGFSMLSPEEEVREQEEANQYGLALDDYKSYKFFIENKKKAQLEAIKIFTKQDRKALLALTKSLVGQMTKDTFDAMNASINTLIDNGDVGLDASKDQKQADQFGISLDDYQSYKILLGKKKEAVLKVDEIFPKESQESLDILHKLMEASWRTRHAAMRAPDTRGIPNMFSLNRRVDTDHILASSLSASPSIPFSARVYSSSYSRQDSSSSVSSCGSTEDFRSVAKAPATSGKVVERRRVDTVPKPHM